MFTSQFLYTFSLSDVPHLLDGFPDTISHVKPYQALPSQFSYCLKAMKAWDVKGWDKVMETLPCAVTISYTSRDPGMAVEGW